MKKLKDFTKGYSAEDIYNADETRLFNKSLPSRTYNIRGEKYFNGEKSKERVIFLFDAI